MACLSQKSFMTMAKYDNNEAYRVWERMQKAQEGKTPPEFLSTHPSPKNRIEKIKNWSLLFLFVFSLAMTKCNTDNKQCRR